MKNWAKRARQVLFWPLINSEIEDVIQICPNENYDRQDEHLALFFFNLQPKENGFSPAQNLFNHQLCTNLPSVQTLIPQNAFFNETPRLRKMTNSLQIFHKEIPSGSC